MMDWLGTRDAVRVGQESVRFQVFDGDGSSDGAQLFGQERVQGEIYRNFVAAAKRGKAEKNVAVAWPERLRQDDGRRMPHPWTGALLVD